MGHTSRSPTRLLLQKMAYIHTLRFILSTSSQWTHLPDTVIRVKGYSKYSEEPLEWSVDFPSGYHLPFLVKMEEFSGKTWKNIYKIEIVADFGYDALDWEFCVDDLEVQFFALPQTEGRNKLGIQAPLHEMA